MPRFRMECWVRRVLILAGALFYLPVAVQAQGLEQSGKNWKVQFNADFLHESNVTQKPEDPSQIPASLTGTPSHDSAFHAAGRASYVYRHDNRLKIQADYDADITVYQNLGQYDLVAQMWGFKPTYKLQPLLNLDLQYFYVWNLSGGNSFSGVHYLSPGLSHMHTDWGLTRLYYLFKNTDNFLNNLRDVDQHGFGLDHIYFWNNYQHSVGLGYQYEKEDAGGTTYDRSLHNLKINGKTELPMGIQLQGQYKFSLRDYDTLASSNVITTRGDLVHNFTVDLRKQIVEQLGFLEKLTGHLRYSRTTTDTNLLVREFTNNSITGGIEARF